MLSWTDFPPEFVVWKLNPKGCTLSAKELAPGVYALLSFISGVGNAVLVIDASISIPVEIILRSRGRYSHKSTISLYILDTMGQEKVRRFFERVSFPLFLIGYAVFNLILPLAARASRKRISGIGGTNE